MILKNSKIKHIKGAKSKKLLKIIYSNAPIRINDIGGWTDTWFSGEGKVLNMGVSPSVEVQIKIYENRKIREGKVLVHAVNYRETFFINPEKPSYDNHPLLQAAMSSLPIPKEFDLEVTIRSRVPAGSSTGTSASVCVALLGALCHLISQKLSLDEIVSLAHRVETVKLELQSGIQDQICAAYGGICFIHMHRYPRAQITRLNLGDLIIQRLNRRLSLIYLGESHKSSALHQEVISFLEEKGTQFKIFERLRNLAEQAKRNLINGDLKSFGNVMIQNNQCQRSLHEELISEEADAVIKVAKKYNAAGWKVNGAGGRGGSLTILGSEDNSLREKMLQKIDSLGSRIKSIPVSLSLSGLSIKEDVKNIDD